MNGGCDPTGIIDTARLALATADAVASAMLVPGWK